MNELYTVCGGTLADHYLVRSREFDALIKSGFFFRLPQRKVGTGKYSFPPVQLTTINSKIGGLAGNLHHTLLYVITAHDDGRLLERTGIQIAKKSLLGVQPPEDAAQL